MFKISNEKPFAKIKAIRIVHGYFKPLNTVSFFLGIVNVKKGKKKYFQTDMFDFIKCLHYLCTTDIGLSN